MAADTKKKMVETAANFANRVADKSKYSTLEEIKMQRLSTKYQRINQISTLRKRQTSEAIRKRRELIDDKFSKLIQSRSKVEKINCDWRKEVIKQRTIKDENSKQLKKELLGRRCDIIRIKRDKDLHVQQNLFTLRQRSEESKRKLWERMNLKNQHIKALKLEKNEIGNIIEYVNTKMRQLKMESGYSINSGKSILSKSGINTSNISNKESYR